MAEKAERPASRILELTAYAVSALLVAAVPVIYIALRFETAGPTLVTEAAWALAGAASICSVGLGIVYAFPLRMVRRIEDDLHHRAETDVLTGLLNRGSLRRRIAEARARADRAETSVAVMFLDLDDFKMVNDTMGHAAGDELLREVATRLRAILRAGDLVARLGGDEFAFVIEDTTNEGAGLVAAKLLRGIRQPYTLAGRRHDLSCCIGIAMHPGDAGDADQLLAYSNIAMRECKRRGKSDFAFYSQSMQVQLEERLRRQQLVRAAWEAREFSIHYQPIADMGQNRLAGAEALIRWTSEELGDVPAQNLIRTLEEMGLIGEVGDWVLREACLQARAWSDAGLPAFVMSVNVAPRQFRSGEALVSSVRTALAEATLHPGRLQIEITEGAMMETRGESLLTMNQLKALGISIAVDDFGTGYSSLSYLKHFPVDALKIDRVFVSELSPDAADANIVMAIMQLARGLGLSVIAEGVETEEQLALLQGYSCDAMQGYTLGRPMNAERFERHVLRNPAWLQERAHPQPEEQPVEAAPAPSLDDDDRTDRTVPVRTVRIKA
jgi:diguanylate cyclase (GGDEF)-like protein